MEYSITSRTFRGVFPANLLRRDRFVRYHKIMRKDVMGGAMLWNSNKFPDTGRTPSVNSKNQTRLGSVGELRGLWMPASSNRFTCVTTMRDE